MNFIKIVKNYFAKNEQSVSGENGLDEMTEL